MSGLERGCRGRSAWCVGSCVCVPEGLFEAIYIINPLLTVLPYYRTARTFVALVWRPLESDQSVGAQRGVSCRLLDCSSDPGSLVAPYRPLVVVPPVGARNLGCGGELVVLRDVGLPAAGSRLETRA